MLERNVQQLPDVLQPPGRDPGPFGDEPAPLVRVVRDVAGLLQYLLKLCLERGDGRREPYPLPGLSLVPLGELLKINCPRGAQLGQVPCSNSRSPLELGSTWSKACNRAVMARRRASIAACSSWACLIRSWIKVA